MWGEERLLRVEEPIGCKVVVVNASPRVPRSEVRSWGGGNERVDAI